MATLNVDEPEVLRVIGTESIRNGTSALTSRQIDQIIKGQGGKEEACLGR